MKTEKFKIIKTDFKGRQQVLELETIYKKDVITKKD